MKRQENEFLRIFLQTLAPSVLGNWLIGKGGVMRAEKDVERAGKVYSNMDHMGKNFKFRSMINAISRLLGTSIKNLGLMVFIQEITYVK